jgi:hypothetical protein
MSVRLAANITAASSLEVDGLFFQEGLHRHIGPIGQELRLSSSVTLADAELNNTNRVRVQVK